MFPTKAHCQKSVAPGAAVFTLILVVSVAFGQQGTSRRRGEGNAADQGKAIALKYIVNEGGVPRDRSAASIPEHLEPFVREAEDEILKAGKEAGKRGMGAIVFTVLSADGNLRAANAEVHRLEGSGYRPYRVFEDDPKAYVALSGPVELRVYSRGYQTFTRKIVLRDGWIFVWDDILLEPLSEAEAAIVFGMVRLEGDANAEGIPISVDGERVTTTDSRGAFTVEGVRSGEEIRISAWKRGYTNLYTVVKTSPGKRVECELRGFRERKARVRWVYQPEEVNHFRGNVLSGEAILTPTSFDRISLPRASRE